MNEGALRELIVKWRTENYPSDDHCGLLTAADELEALVEYEPSEPCPECGRGVHKGGSHTLNCTRRNNFEWLVEQATYEQ